MKKRLNTYTFKFNDETFYPIVVKVNEKEIALPICRMELLETAG